MEMGKMDDFSLSDLAGSTAIILASCGGLITVILSSRCLIKCRLGCTDEFNLCMCERKPPPDPEDPPAPVKKKEEDKELHGEEVEAVPPNQMTPQSSATQLPSQP